MTFNPNRIGLAVLVLTGAANGAGIGSALESGGHPAFVSVEIVLTLFLAFWAAIVPSVD